MAGFASIPAAAAAPHAPLLQPILFCGHGNNLYPLCSSPTSSPFLDDAQDAASTSLPKALLPILNRPMIAYPLQQLLSAGLRHVIILAPSEQHQQIASALKSLILIPPVLTGHGKKAASAAAAAAVEEATKHPNLSVTVGLSSAPVTAAPASAGYLAGGSLPSMSTSSSEAAVMKVDLLPLGPDDYSTAKSSAEADSAAKGKRSRKMGSAALITWLHSIGRLTRDPLMVPLDFIGQGVSLTTLIHSHVAGVPDSPTMTCLMYERGAGEGTGKEREKDGPPKLFTMYDRTPLPSSGSLVGSDGAHSNHSLHRLLLLQDSDDISDHDSSDLHIRMSLLWSHPHTRISTSLLDSHIYIFNLAKLIGLLSSKEGEKMKSIREEVVPFVAKCSWMKGLREKAGWYSEASTSNVTGRSSSIAAGQSSGTGATSSYVPWTMQASKEEIGGVRRSTTFVEPELLEGRSGKADSAISPSAKSGGYLGVGDARSSPLFTPDMSRAPSPRTKEAVLRSFTPVNPASPSHEDGPAPSAALSTSQNAKLKALAKKSASEIRAVALVVRLSKELDHPLEAGLTIDEVKQRQAEESAANGVAAEKFIARANTVPTYIECNRYLLRALSSDSILSGALPHPLPKSAVSSSSAAEDLIDAKAQILSDSVVGENTRVGERAMVKRSVVGRNCTVAKNAKITGCIVMDNVRIGENVKLENCIICAGATVEDKSNLKDCDVAAAVTVTSGTSSKNEKFDE